LGFDGQVSFCFGAAGVASRGLLRYVTVGCVGLRCGRLGSLCFGTEVVSRCVLAWQAWRVTLGCVRLRLGGAGRVSSGWLVVVNCVALW